MDKFLLGLATLGDRSLEVHSCGSDAKGVIVLDSHQEESALGVRQCHATITFEGGFSRVLVAKERGGSQAIFSALLASKECSTN